MVEHTAGIERDNVRGAQPTTAKKTRQQGAYICTLAGFCNYGMWYGLWSPVSAWDIYLPCARQAHYLWLRVLGGVFAQHVPCTLPLYHLSRL